MKYMLLIHDLPGDLDSLPEEERGPVLEEYVALTRDPRFVSGARLQPPDTATTVRVSGGDTLTTDGPFAETKEQLGGFYIFEADDLDAAIELASRIPSARMGGAIEVRPMVES